MAYPMIALTTEGTSFACASVSLTETGLAVLDENGGRIGFVPYDSLAYVAPTEESRIKDAPMRVRTADGSTFGAAAISQASAGIAVLNPSGARIGFVPYDSLAHVLPEAKTGPTLPADATPVDGVAIQGEDDGGSPVWAGDEERVSEEGDDDSDSEESADDDAATGDAEDGDGAEEDTAEEEPADADGDESADGADSEDRDVGTDGPVWGGEPVEHSERGGDADGGGDEAADASDEPTATGGSQAGNEPAGSPEEREAAAESELVVDWSFGDE